MLILDAIHTHLHPLASSFYSYYEPTELLSLRAQRGLDYQNYKSFQMPLQSTPGRAIRLKKVLAISDVRDQKDFRDTTFISQYGLEKMVVVPLPRSEQQQSELADLEQEYVGVICVYPVANQELDSLVHTLTLIAPIISGLYQHSVIREMLEIRRDTMETALGARDIDSFLHRLVLRLNSNWDYEALSVFLVDERSKTLRLKATTGLINSPKKTEVQYRLDEESATVRALNSGRPTLITNHEGRHLSGKYQEVVASKKLGVLIAPIFEPTKMDQLPPRCMGILRVVNRILSFDSRREPVCFGWEDAVFLRFTCSIIAVIAYLFGRVASKGEDFERAIHGVEGAILSVRAGLTQLAERTEVVTNIEPRFSYVIPNALANLEALGWQIERFSRPEHIPTLPSSRVNLAGDVLSKLQIVLQTMVRSFGDPSQGFRITNIAERFIKDRQSGIPAVRGDSAALMTVFRNLLENAVKYSKRRSLVDVILDWRDDDSYVYVSFADFGIGIDKGDAPYIFLESFKAEEAMRRHPVGIGLGLYQAKQIMQQLGGEITLTQNREPTMFLVKMHKWKEIEQ